MGTLVPLTVLQNDDVPVNLSVLQANGTFQNCTGYSAEMIIKTSQNTSDTAPTSVVLGTETSGLTWASQASGTLTAELGTSVTGTPANLWWALHLYDGEGNRTTAMYGPLTIVAC